MFSDFKNSKHPPKGLYFVIFFSEKIVTTSGILRAFVLLYACRVDIFKDFEIKSSLFFKKSGEF